MPAGRRKPSRVTSRLASGLGGAALHHDGQIPSGIRTRVRGLAPLETVKGVTLGPDLDKRDLKRPTAGGTVTAGVPPQASGGGARSGRTPEASDSKLARRVRRSQPLPRDPLAGEHERKRLRPKTVELSPGSAPWRHGDLRRLLPDRGMIRADRSTTCPPDGVLAEDRSSSPARTHSRRRSASSLRKPGCLSRVASRPLRR